MEISPKGKVNIYYDRYDDLNKGVRIIRKLLACDSFSIERDLPRTLKSVREGIEANLADLIEPGLSQRLNYDNYNLQTAAPKTSKALAEGLRNYLTNLTKILEYKRAVEEMENTTGWVVTFSMAVTVLRRAANYLGTCDNLTEELTSSLKQSPYGFRLCDEDRDGEGLSLRYAFTWRPADGPLDLPPYPKKWEILELAPFKSIYPDPDFEDIYGDDDDDDLG